jgi:hypothetical protein
LRWLYGKDVAISRRPEAGRVPPVARPAELQRYEGKWVALLDGKVLVSADTDVQLASKLRQLGPQGQEAVMHFIRPAMAGYVIGVG